MFLSPAASLRLRLGWLVLALGACHQPAAAAIQWAEVSWFSWTANPNPGASTGAVLGQSISLTLSGANATNAGASSSNFDMTAVSGYESTVPGLGLGAPKGGTVVTYTLDLSALTIPASNLVFGIANLDAINGRGSLTVSALDDLNQAVNVNAWETAGQFKQQAGVPSAQALVTLNPVGNAVQLGSVQAGDNTSWGDSRGIFFSALQADLKSIAFSHYYNHPTPSVSDNISLYVGVIPEPAHTAWAAGLVGLAALARRRRR